MSSETSSGAQPGAAAVPRDIPRTRTLRVTCPHDCPDTCSMLVDVEVESDRAVGLRGDPDHPITRGFLCGKVNNYLDLVYSDQRVLYPHRRVGPRGPNARFERISWDLALQTITDRFKTVIHEFGPEAIQPFSYSGTLGILNFEGMSERFWNRMGAARLTRTICTGAGRSASLATTGHVGEANIENIPGMDLIVLWATNVVSTSVHMVPLLNEARNNGARIIAIDPRVTRTTKIADWHIQPRPGTDAALALGMLKIIVDRGMHDKEFLAVNTVGADQLMQRLPEYDLASVAEITGLTPQVIEQLALEYGRTKKSFIRLNWGIQRHDNGGMMTRSIYMLPVFTGALSSGGGICVGTAQETRGIDRDKLHRPDLLEGRTPRTVNMNLIGDALTGARLDPPIKALYCWNSDLVNCVQDRRRTVEGLLRPDLFIAVHDTFFTDTTDYADIVLPADTCLERTDFHGAYGNYYFSLSNPAIAKLGESIDNQETFRRLASAMGYTDDCFSDTDETMIRELISENPNPLYEGLDFDTLARKGWTRGCVDSPRRAGVSSGTWPTPSGKIEIYSGALAAEGLDPLPAHIDEQEGFRATERRKRYPLQVISAATHHFIGNSFQSVAHLREMTSRPTFELSHEDAGKRGIHSGDRCRLFNDRGEAFGFAELIDGLLPGVVGAQKQLGGINNLCEARLSDMGGAPVYYSMLAEIEKAAPEGALPE